MFSSRSTGLIKEKIFLILVITIITSVFFIDRSTATEVKFNKRVLALGDSVMLGASEGLIKTFPNLILDAQVSRNTKGMLKELKLYKKSGLIPDYVLLHIGTNYPHKEKELKSIFQLLSNCKKIVVLNARAPRFWIKKNNTLLKKTISDLPNVKMVDWQTVCNKNKRKILGRDGIHVKKAGSKIYAKIALDAFI